MTRYRSYIAVITLATALFLGAFSVASAATVNYYVDPTGTDVPGNGTASGASAWQTIQYAITNVANPATDTVIINIAAGTYNTSNTTISINRSFADLKLLGVSATSTIVEPATSIAASTARVFNVSSGNNVTFERMEIRYGYLTSGGGAAIWHQGGNLTLRDTWIENNNGTGGTTSGGVLSAASTTIERTTFSNNSGAYVSAFYVSSPNATITNSTFYNNSNTSYGMGVYVYQTNLTMTNSLFASSTYMEIQNTSAYTAQFKNSVVLGSPNSNAIYYYNFSGIINDNGTNIVGGETGAGGSTGPYFTNGVNGTAKVSNATTLSSLGISTMLADNSSANGVPTLALQAGSQAIDGGSGGANSGITIPALDARGLYRGSIPDIGPYEYNATAGTPSFSSPMVAATNVSVSTVSQASATISWTNGDGAMRAVFVKADATSGSSAPVDGTTYEGNSAFGSGTQIGSSGWYAVYNGTSTAVTVSGLDSTKNYRMHVVEYNGPYNGVSKYLTSAGSGNPITKSAYAGTTIYTNSSTGSDTTGDGSSGNPYKTFTKAYTASIDGDTIDLTGTFDWSNASETGDVSAYGYRIYKDNLTVRGQGATSTIIQAFPSWNASNNERVFTLYTAGISFTVQNATVRYGDTTSFGACFGFQVASTTLNIRNASVTSCRTRNGGSPGGSAIYANQNNTIVNINNSSFSANSITSSANGGVINSSGIGNIFYITSTTFSGNQAAAGSYGNTLYLVSTGGAAYFTNDTITGNYGGTNGALAVSSGTVYLKNSIIADTFSTNLYKTSGSFVSNGYNIIGAYSTAYFNATTTGDWTDRLGSGTYMLYNGGTTGSLSLGATTTAANGTVYAPLQVGSIGIDQGTTTANGSISIPVVDQLGQSRSGVTDIGAVEYILSDATPPTVSLTAPTDGATVSGLVTFSANASDNVAVAGVKFYVNGVLTGGEVTSAPYSLTWGSYATTSAAKTIVAVARDSSNNYATSTAASVTTSNVPMPTLLSYLSATTSATLSWTTPVAGSSKVFFGLMSALASSTPTQDTGTTVITHSINIAGLPPCAVYRYLTVSQNVGVETATSTQSTFKTAGCTGSASITENGEGSITTASGGTLTQGALTLTVPTSFTGTSSSATFQASKLDGASFFASAGAPSSKTRVGSTVFHLSAFTDDTTTLSTFSAPLSVTLSYSASDVAGLDESTLAIQRYDGTTWSTLLGCSINTSARTVTCSTTGFSDFAIFGTASVSSSSNSNSTGGGGTVVGLIGTNKTFQWFGYVAPRLQTVYPNGRIVYLDAPTNPTTVVSAITTTPAIPQNSLKFTRDLRKGMIGNDVRELQRYLNGTECRVAGLSDGSTGKETTYFGARTRDAVSCFQKANGVMPAAGYFGHKTRMLINER